MRKFLTTASTKLGNIVRPVTSRFTSLKSYTLAKIKKGKSYTLAKIEKGQSYTLAKIKKGKSYTLAKIEKTPRLRSLRNRLFKKRVESSIKKEESNEDSTEESSQIL